MIKIKSQKIIPNVPPESARGSFSLSSQDLVDSRSDLDFYAIFDYEVSAPINSLVARNVVTDVFSHALNSDSSQAVLQVLERAVKDTGEALHKVQPTLVFNAAVALFKDDYIYISIYGNSKALYLDGSQIVHVDTEKEGNYAGGFQKLDSGRVMILCTKNFFEKFPPKSLVSLEKPILSQDLDELSSAVILKIDKEEEPVVQVPVEISSVDTPIKKIHITSSVKESVSYINAKTGKKLPERRTVYIVLAALALLAVIALVILRKPASKTEPPKQAVVPVEEQKKEEPQVPEVQGELTKKLDEANKVKRVNAQVFYDVSITDSKTSPTELAAGTTYVAVSDASQGKIYVSAKSVTKFEELPQMFPGVKNLLFDGDTLIFTDNEGVKFYSIPTKAVTKSYLSDVNYPTLGPTSEYLGFTYSVSGTSLVKFTKAGNKLSGSLWLQKPEFENGVSMDIDGSIYVLFSNGSLEKYTSGTKDDFSIVGLDKAIQKPLKVVADPDFKQIYVADAEEGRIIVFDNDGVLAYQFKPQPGSEWTELKSFDVSRDEKSLYVLSGTKVFEFNIPL